MSGIFGVPGRRVRERLLLLENPYFERGYLPELNALSRRAARMQGACFFASPPDGSESPRMQSSA